MNPLDAVKDVELRRGNGNGRGFRLLWIGFPQWALLSMVVGGIALNSIGTWRLFEWVDRHERLEEERLATSTEFIKQTRITIDVLAARMTDVEFDSMVSRMILRQEKPATADAIENMLRERQQRRGERK